MKYLFGPVNSRRLGISLGIDLLPFKTCSLDCVYCECGKTIHLTTQIDQYVPTEEVIAELREFLKNKPALDAITFAGSGEPVLHSGIERIIVFLKKNYPEYKISVLTNSTLLYLKEARKSILDADIIIPSLDAASEEIFLKIARPAKGITAEKIIEGLIELRKEFKNTIILEIFIIPGLNDNENEVCLIKAACTKISPDIIQLNTLDRPGTEKCIEPASMEKLQEIKTYLEPLKVEIIERQKSGEDNQSKRPADISEAIISTISRRPSTLEDISVFSGISIDEASKIIDHFIEKGTIIKEESIPGKLFYMLKIQ